MVKQISRFISNKQKLEIYEEISNGTAQIIVGTHALLNDKINFKKLGLIIHDEEQKLGTKQKEKLKEKNNHYEASETASYKEIKQTF